MNADPGSDMVNSGLPAGEVWVAVAVVLVLLALMAGWLLVRHGRR